MVRRFSGRSSRSLLRGTLPPSSVASALAGLATANSPVKVAPGAGSGEAVNKGQLDAISVGPGGGIADAPNNANYYLRHALGWIQAGAAALLGVGTTAGTVADGGDGRFTDARVPLAHKASHQSGGSDALSLDASQIGSGTLDVARIPVVPSQVQVVSSGDLAALTTGQQAAIGQGTVVTTTDGSRWVYTGTGSKTAQASYIQLADITPDWSVVQGKPAFAGAALLNVGTTAGTVAAGDDSRITGAAPAASPTLTGTVTVPTAAAGTSNGQAASTAFVRGEVAALTADPYAFRANLGLRRGRDVTPTIDNWGAAAAGTTTPLNCVGAFCRNLTKQVNYFAKAADTTTVSPASTVKMLSSVVVMREVGLGLVLASTTTTVLTGENVSGTSASLQVGDVISLLDLLYGMLLPSGNDAAEVMARAVGDIILARTGTGVGGRVRFIAEMNIVAGELGMASSSFNTPHGGGVKPTGATGSTVDTVTARDICRLLAVYGTDPVLGPISVTASHLMTVTGANARTYTVTHSSTFVYPNGADGSAVAVKGGSNASGDSFSCLWQAPNGDLIAAVCLVSPGRTGNRYLDNRRLFWEALLQFDLNVRDTDANFGSVKFLFGGDTGYIDESSVARTLTNTAATRTSDPTKLIAGTASTAFDGSTAHVDAPDAADLVFGGSDFTVEALVRGTGSVPSGAACVVGKWLPTGNQRAWMLQYDPSPNYWQFFFSTNGTTFPSALWTCLTNNVDPAVVWNGGLCPLLVQRSGTSVDIYFCGEKGDTPYAVGAGTMFAGNAKLELGARDNGGGASTLFLSCILDEVRITNGVARLGAPPAKYQALPRKFARA